MGRMSLNQDEALRQQGWRVFRSASRDHQTPLVGADRKLMQFRIREAFPVLGVTEGAQAISLEERAANAEAAAALRAKTLRTPIPEADRVTRHISLNWGNRAAVPAAGSEEEIDLIVAPSDGFITELIWQSVVSATTWLLALRTDTGESVFLRGLAQNPAPFPAGGPDFVNPLGFNPALFYSVSVTKCRVPVRSGERIFAVMRMPGPTPVNTNLVEMVMGFEFADVSLSRKLTLEQSVARAVESAKFEVRGLSQTVANARKAADEELKRIAGQLAESSAAVLKAGAAAAKRVSVVKQPVPPKVPRPAPELPAGSDKTFVSAWNPSFGNIGYLIPDPPRGGRVNVFDNKYTVWDITGKMVSQGPIEPIATVEDIPPGAMISPVRGGVKSPAMRVDTVDAFT